MAFEAILYSGEIYGTAAGVVAPRPFIGALLVCTLQLAGMALSVAALLALLGV